MVRENLKKVLQDNISFEGYGDGMPNTIPSLFTTFMSEYFEACRIGQQKNDLPKVISEWLRGLPSVISMPYNTHEIVNLLRALGYETEGMEPIEIDDLYWSELGEIIYANM